MISRMRILVAVVLALTLALVVGCSKKAEEPELTPKVAPPAIGQAGTLRAGVDLDYPPFGGADGGKRAGIDIDVAAALSERLGLKLAIVDVKPVNAAEALTKGDVDVVFSVPIDSKTLSNASLAGTYLADGPAFFVASETSKSADASVTIGTIDKRVVVAQKGSMAQWRLEEELGTGSVKLLPTLREAFEALTESATAGSAKKSKADSQPEIVAGDAIVGAYIARDFPGVVFAGQIGDAAPIGVAVAAENSALADPVRAALDALASDGVLDTIRRKWVGELPELKVATETTATP